MRFPIICFREDDDFIYGFESLDFFEQTSTDLIHKYNNLTVIDSDSILYIIERAVFKKWNTLLWGFSLFSMDRLIRVNFIINRRQPISLEQIKDSLIVKLNRASIVEEKRFWYKESDKPFLIEAVTESQDLKSLMNLFVYGIENIDPS